MVEAGVKEPEEGAIVIDAQNKVLEETRMKDFKDKNILSQVIDKNALKTIAERDTAKDIWDSLKTKYHGNES